MEEMERTRVSDIISKSGFQYLFFVKGNILVLFDFLLTGVAYDNQTWTKTSPEMAFKGYQNGNHIELSEQRLLRNKQCELFLAAVVLKVLCGGRSVSILVTSQ